jgi:hypothetical protein
MSHLPPAHQIMIKVKQPKCPRFEFKPQQVNESSQSNHCQYIV